MLLAYRLVRLIETHAEELSAGLLQKLLQCPQADEYRDLEYYLSYVSNGLPISGPGARP